MVMLAPIGYPLGYLINMLLGLALENYFGIREVYLVGVSLDTLYGLMIGTVEGPVVGLSLRLSIV